MVQLKVRNHTPRHVTKPSGRGLKDTTREGLVLFQVSFRPMAYGRKRVGINWFKHHSRSPPIAHFK